METIRAQTMKDWELIVCDSHSDDGAWEFFQQFKGDPRIQLNQVPRQGVYAGWNECLRRVKGEFVYIATSDDTADLELLQVMTGALQRFPDVKMATCNFTFIDDRGTQARLSDYADAGARISGAEIYGDWLAKDHRRHGASEFVATCVDSHVWTTITAVLFRASLLKDIGLFPEDKTAMGDLEWALRACLATDTIHVAQSLATFRLHQQQATHAVDFSEHGFLHVNMVEETLKSFADRLPPALRDRRAQLRLLRPKQVLAFNGLQLYWNILLKSPLTFSHRLLLGLKRSPHLVMHQALHGFRWRSRPRINAKEYVEALLAELQLPPICEPVAL